MQRSQPPSTPPVAFDEQGALRDAMQALAVQRWADARQVLLDHARRSPSTTRYRALLAYARGHEADAAGDDQRAREEWRRAVILDPSLESATRPLAARRRRRSWVARLLGAN